MLVASLVLADLWTNAVYSVLMNTHSVTSDPSSKPEAPAKNPTRRFALGPSLALQAFMYCRLTRMRHGRRDKREAARNNVRAFRYAAQLIGVLEKNSEIWLIMLSLVSTAVGRNKRSAVPAKCRWVPELRCACSGLLLFRWEYSTLFGE
jgi:hypothetical protein